MEQLRVGGEYKDSTLMMIYLGVLPCIKEKNSVHDIFLGFRCVVEVFSVNVKSVLCCTLGSSGILETRMLSLSLLCCHQ